MKLGYVLFVATVFLGGTAVDGSLMNRIGLRLGGKAYHEKHTHEHHRPRVPWAVKHMREDMMNEDTKPWKNNRSSKEKIADSVFPFALLLPGGCLKNNLPPCHTE